MQLPRHVVNAFTYGNANPGDETAEAKTLRIRVARAFARVYGEAPEVTGGGNDIVRVWADGWPRSWVYRGSTALEVLAALPAGAGKTKSGDEKVRRTLEREGAMARTW